MTDLHLTDICQSEHLLHCESLVLRVQEEVKRTLPVCTSVSVCACVSEYGRAAEAKGIDASTSGCSYARFNGMPTHSLVHSLTRFLTDSPRPPRLRLEPRATVVEMP